MQKKGTASGKWAQRMERLTAWCDAHWWGPGLITVASGFSGFPPFAVWSLLAGTIRMRWWQVAADEVPAGDDERLEWLQQWWVRIDDWIDEHRPAPAPS